DALDAGKLDALGLRVEDKGPIQALHWRGAVEERAAESHAHEIANDAGRAGLEPHWGRKVLELRPVGGGGKDAAVAALVAAGGLRRRRPHRPRRLPPSAGAQRGRRAAARDLHRGRLSGGAAGAGRRVGPERRRPAGLAGDARGAGRLAVPYTDLLRLSVFLTA